MYCTIDSKISVSIFNFKGETREVVEWTQPLFCVKGRGLVQLATRKIHSNFEYLLTIGHEPGISTEFALYPSYVKYHEDKIDEDNKITGTILIELTQCDEGGRFYRNDSLYQIIEVSAEYKPKENQIWINQKELKSFLKSSNVASFQLRCICSLLLNKLNPYTF